MPLKNNLADLVGNIGLKTSRIYTWAKAEFVKVYESITDLANAIPTGNAELENTAGYAKTTDVNRQIGIWDGWSFTSGTNPTSQDLDSPEFRASTYFTIDNAGLFEITLPTTDIDEGKIIVIHCVGTGICRIKGNIWDKGDKTSVDITFGENAIFIYKNIRWQRVNNFDSSGTYPNLRAQGTTKEDIGILANIPDWRGVANDLDVLHKDEGFVSNHAVRNYVAQKSVYTDVEYITGSGALYLYFRDNPNVGTVYFNGTGTGYVITGPSEEEGRKLTIVISQSMNYVYFRRNNSTGYTETYIKPDGTTTNQFEVGITITIQYINGNWYQINYNSNKPHGGFYSNVVRTSSTNYTVQDDDVYIIMTNSSSARVNLPTPTTENKGRTIWVKEGNSAVRAYGKIWSNQSNSDISFADGSAIQFVSDGIYWQAQWLNH